MNITLFAYSHDKYHHNMIVASRYDTQVLKCSIFRRMISWNAI